MKTLFIDFDGTICFDRFWRSLPIEEYSKVEQVLFKENRTMFEGWMRGTYTSEDINHFISKESGIDYEYLWEVFVRDCKTMHVSKEILEAITLLPQNFHTILITGNMDCFDRFTVPTLKLNEYFDVIVNSYNEGILKSENGGETFKKYLKGEIDDAILIEDSLKSCEVFENIGGSALRVTPEHSALFHLKSLLSC